MQVAAVCEHRVVGRGRAGAPVALAKGHGEGWWGGERTCAVGSRGRRRLSYSLSSERAKIADLCSARVEKIRGVGLPGEAAVVATCDAGCAGRSGRGERRISLLHGVQGAQGAGVGKPAAGPSRSFTRMMSVAERSSPDRRGSRRGEFEGFAGPHICTTVSSGKGLGGGGGLGMGAVEAQNDRGSPGDKRLQKVRAVEVVHVLRLLDLDLPSESV